jgi:hypothetical protein
MRKTIWIVPLLVAFAATGARANEVYSFKFVSPFPASTPGQIESFAFSFTVPTFVTTGQSPAFTPLTITNGTNSATLTDDYAVQPVPPECGLGTGNPLCISAIRFGTSTDSLITDGGIQYGPPDGGAIEFNFVNSPFSLPTGEGTYKVSLIGCFFVSATTGSCIGPGSSTGEPAKLTIGPPTVPTPEPSSSALMLLGIGFVVWVMRKRNVQGLPHAT